MINKKIILIILAIIIPVSMSQLLFSNKNVDGNVQEVAMSKNLEDLSIQQLTEIRDKCVDKNVGYLNNFGQTSNQELQDRKLGILTSEWGLVTFFNKNYSNLTEKEKLIKQTKLVEYLNSKEDIMDPAGSYFEASNEEYQLSEYLVQKGRGSNTISYENLKFLINNLEDISNFIDYDIKIAIEHIDPSIKISLSQEQKEDLNNELKKISLDDKISIGIKNKIKSL